MPLLCGCISPPLEFRYQTRGTQLSAMYVSRRHLYKLTPEPDAIYSSTLKQQTDSQGVEFTVDRWMAM